MAHDPGWPTPRTTARIHPAAKMFNFEQTVSARCEKVAGSHRLASNPLAGRIDTRNTADNLSAVSAIR